MKKVVVMLAIAVCALAHAASLNWTISNVKTPADSGVVGEGYSAYLFLTATTGAQPTTTADAVIASIADGSFGTGYAAKGATSAAGSIMGDTGMGGAFGAGDSLSGFAVIFDGDFNAANGGNYIVTAVKTASWTSSTGAKTLAFGSQANATWTTYGGSTPEGTPEPTSGLLLLVGGAMLALRRKQK